MRSAFLSNFNYVRCSGVMNDRRKVIIGNYLGGTPHVNIWTGDRGQWTIGVIMGLTLS